MRILDILKMGFFDSFGFTLTLFGIPFYVSGWTLIPLLFFAFDARIYIRRQMRDYPGTSFTLASIGASFIVLLSVLVHELSHSFVAYLYGKTTMNGGFTAWGAYVELEESVTEGPWHLMTLIGLSGPLANFAIALAAMWVVYKLGESRFENVVQYVAYINVLLGLFNLIPAFGLDGSKVSIGLLMMVFSVETSLYISLLLSLLAIYLLVTRWSSFFKPIINELNGWLEDL